MDYTDDGERIAFLAANKTDAKRLAKEEALPVVLSSCYHVGSFATMNKFSFRKVHAHPSSVHRPAEAKVSEVGRVSGPSSPTKVI